MADFVFNIAKGKVAYYASLPAADDAIIVLLLLTSGLESDAVLKDKDDVAALVSGATDEATGGAYVRKTAATVTVTVDDSGDLVDVDCADITWTALACGPVAKLVFAYDGDTTGGADSAIIPLTCHDFAVTPDGTDVVAQVTATGFFRAS